MRLIIKHYLSILKERDELDAILPDLLLAVGIIPISRPQVGPRQYGVDIAAVGDDPKDGIRKLFLFTVKHGDFGRSDWESGQQAVRPSINEILDTYIPTHIDHEHLDLPRKIVVVAGGELKQDHKNTWANYTKKNAEKEQLEIAFWGGDQLAPMIEEHLLNEQLLPAECRKLLHKSISFAGDPNYDLRDLYALFDQLYQDVDGSETTRKRKCSKRIRSATLCLLVFSRWSEDEENLKQPFMASERLVLKTWDFIRRHDLFDYQRVVQDFVYCRSLFHKACSALFNKIQPHCAVQDGLFTSGGAMVEHPVRVFEFIGIISLIGMDQVYLAHMSDQSGDTNQHADNAAAICNTLMALINNNPISSSPAFDSHANEISMAFMLMVATGNQGYAASWLDSLLEQIAFAFYTDAGYPIATDSHEDLLAMRMGRVEKPEKLKFCSTLLPILAEFCVVFDQLIGSKLYDKISEMSRTVFKELNFQIWHPNEDTENFLYNSNAGFRSGICFNSISLPKSVEEFKQNIEDAMSNSAGVDEFSCFDRGLPILPHISSRHFRTPQIPNLWRNSLLMGNHEAEQEATPEEPAKTS